MRRTLKKKTHVGELIREAMDQKEFTNKNLSKRMRVTPVTLWHWMHKPLPESCVNKLTKHLGLDKEKIIRAMLSDKQSQAMQWYLNKMETLSKNEESSPVVIRGRELNF